LVGARSGIGLTGFALHLPMVSAKTAGS
jgi:hypothetical protein